MNEKSLITEKNLISEVEGNLNPRRNEAENPEPQPEKKSGS